LPQDPNTFVSGDGNDKCFVWQVKPKNENQHECVKIGELVGHTETVEFIRFNHDGKLCLTGGMNNTLRVWRTNTTGDFTLKTELENGPSGDINFA
jgi:WD40 repeat protein